MILATARKTVALGLALGTLSGCGEATIAADLVEQRDGLLRVAATGQAFTGVVESYFPDSRTVLARTTYREGIRHGVSEGFDVQGHRLIQESFTEGSRSGRRLEYWPSGRLRKRQTFVDGELSGLVETWSESGQPLSKELREDGRRQGRAVSWYENGQVATEASYDHGVLDGVLRLWYESGLQKAVKCFEGGLPHGLQEEWHENGRLRLRMEWVRGEAEGPFIRWFEDGTVRAEGRYSHGELVELRTYSRDGTVEATIGGARRDSGTGS